MSLARLRRLARTTALRSALRHALVNVLALALALGALFVLLNRYTDRQIEASLRGEAATLASQPAARLAGTVTALATLRGGEHALRYYRLENGDGRPLAGNVARWPAALAADGVLRTVTLTPRGPGEDRDEALRLSALAVPLPDGGRLLVAQPPGPLEDLRELALGLAAAVLGLSAVLSLALGISLGWRWLGRIEAINATAGRIAAGDLGQRVASRGADGQADEFDLLAGHLNAMLARIEAAVTGMRQVSDQIAHDLRRPLARLKTRIEVVLAQPRPAAEYRAALEATAADADELMRAFEAMLSIARLEAGSEIPRSRAFDLAETARGVAELYAAEAEDAGRPFRFHLPGPASMRGEPALLAQALANLLDNAFHYTPPDSAIEVTLQTDGGGARLAVIDHGPGLDAADKARLVERFARGDAARGSPGSGLGLTLARAVARAHGGTLELDDTPGGGLTARLLLPLAAP